MTLPVHGEPSGSTVSDEMILGALPMPVLVVDSDGRYTFANDAACALLGRSLREVIGLTVSDITALGAAWSSFAGEAEQDGEFELQRPDGTKRPVGFHATRDFAPGRHLFVLTDLSDRRRIDAQVRRNEELFLNAFSGSPAPTNILDLGTGTFVETNEAFSKATGYWRSDVVGRRVRDVGIWTDAAMFADSLDRLRAGGVVEGIRVGLVTKDRSRKTFDVALRRMTIHGEAHVIAVYSEVVAEPPADDQASAGQPSAAN